MVTVGLESGVLDTDSDLLRGCSREKPVRLWRKQDRAEGQVSHGEVLGALWPVPDPTGNSRT